MNAATQHPSPACTSRFDAAVIVRNRIGTWANSDDVTGPDENGSFVVRATHGTYRVDRDCAVHAVSA